MRSTDEGSSSKKNNAHQLPLDRIHYLCSLSCSSLAPRPPRHATGGVKPLLMRIAGQGKGVPRTYTVESNRSVSAAGGAGAQSRVRAPRGRLFLATPTPPTHNPQHRNNPKTPPPLDTLSPIEKNRTHTHTHIGLRLLRGRGAAPPQQHASEPQRWRRPRRRGRQRPRLGRGFGGCGERRAVSKRRVPHLRLQDPPLLQAHQPRLDGLPVRRPLPSPPRRFFLSAWGEEGAGVGGAKPQPNPWRLQYNANENSPHPTQHNTTRKTNTQKVCAPGGEGQAPRPQALPLPGRPLPRRQVEPGLPPRRRLPVLPLGVRV